MDSEIEPQTDLETSEPQLQEKRKSVAGEAKHCTTFKSEWSKLYLIGYTLHIAWFRGWKVWGLVPVTGPILRVLK